MGNEGDRVGRNDASVQTHVQTVQDIIGRHASRSASSKAWCITLISALLVFALDKGKANVAYLALVPCGLFYFLDAYYLSLEKDFRSMFDSFVSRLGTGELEASEVFTMSVPGKVGHRLWMLFRSAVSLSVWPFYLTLAAALVVVGKSL